MSKLVSALVVLALAPFALAACGGDDETTASTTDANPATEAIDAAAVPDGSFAFEEDELEAPAGRLTVNFENPAPIAHDFCLEEPDGEDLGCTELIADGDTDVAEFEVEAGDYTYYCSVAGHREGGMEGTLTVE